ncbi:MAG: hypothetical protein KDE27_17550 [Planctomycetes bacterium]|nr:hypothetical protein [Planctomycetota bacterium]
MHKVSLALAVAGTSMSLLAQNCNVSPPAGSLRTYSPWQASFYYGNLTDNSLGYFFDINLQSPVEITSMNVTTYDQGAGNPVVPDQQGNVAEVRIFLIPGTRVGAEGSPATWGIDAAGNGTADGLPEALGELTVVAYGGDSPIVNFKDALGNAAPFNLPAGQYGMCMQVISTNYANTPNVIMNPGALHCIGVSPNPGTVWADQFISISNDGIQQNGWFNHTGGVETLNGTPNGTQDSINLEINYLPAASSAVYVPFGNGCYDRPQAFYELIPENAAPTDLDNTGWTCIPNGSPQENYIVVPGAAYQTVGSGTNLLNGTFTSSSSASWDDACLTQPLGFSFPFPGGATTDITINSNGKIYLGLETDASFGTCGSNYGGTATFQNGTPTGPIAQWCAFNVDLDGDLTLNGGVGAIYFEQFPNPTNPTSARITWEGVPNWPAVVGEVCDIQLTLYDSGQVDLAFGTLYTSGVGSGNTGLIGFSKGDGSPLAPQVDWSSLNGYTTGDGAYSPVLGMASRPVAGSSADVVIDNLSPGTGAGFISIALGFTPSPGFPLGIYGLPNCFAHINPGAVVTSVFVFTNPQNELRWTWNVPTGFNGTQVFLQSGTITPGFNAAGILATNGMCAKIGT